MCVCSYIQLHACVCLCLSTCVSVHLNSKMEPRKEGKGAVHECMPEKPNRFLVVPYKGSVTIYRFQIGMAVCSMCSYVVCSHRL